MDQKAELKQLAKASQEGDATAYRKLLQAITPLIRSFVRKSFRREEQQDDVVQDILMSIHRGLHTYLPEREFTSWMYAIAKFRVIDHLRVTYRFREREVLTDTFADKAENVTEDSDESNYLLAALEKLPAKYREAIKLTKLQELSVQEAAEKLQISESALKARCSRGYKMLRKKLEQAVHEGH